MIPLRYQWSSAELPAPEYNTSAIGPVRSGRMTVFRCSLIRLRIWSPASKKYFSRVGRPVGLSRGPVDYEYRAFLETRPDGFQIEAPRDLEDLCDGLEGVQREGCITGAAVIGPRLPPAANRLCVEGARSIDEALVTFS